MQPKSTKLFWLLFAVAITPTFVEAGINPNSTKIENVIQSEINGRVVDQDGNPVIGASVTNLSNQKVTQTDEYGNFSLQGSVGNQIRVSFVGFETLNQQVSKESGNLFHHPIPPLI